ncbi:porin family protein [Brumimicrobium mesophilum]|uniref:outer membrane beta-barrel protein n=1 Tax=Brumimicrobium mesophilum TaxID=392717 RepID=UPI000D143ED1|nr:outer membrane beta-barrel protein [Brumimicrobium mesophilum]
MKTKIILTIALFGIAFQLFSQDEKSKFTLNFGAGGNYNLMNSGSKIKNHNAIRGLIDLVIKERWVINYSQHGSVNQKGLKKVKVTEDDHFGIYEHSFGFGYKFNFENQFYVLPTTNIGIGLLKSIEYYNSDWEEIKSEFSKEVEGAFFVSQEVRFGYDFGKHLALETHINYSYYSDIHLPSTVSSSDLNGLGFGLTIIGKIPF